MQISAFYTSTWVFYSVDFKTCTLLNIFRCVDVPLWCHQGNIYFTNTSYLQWWFVNPGSDNPEISLIRTKSAGTDFRSWTDGRFSSPENSLIGKYPPGTNVSGLTNHHCISWLYGPYAVMILLQKEHHAGNSEAETYRFGTILSCCNTEASWNLLIAECLFCFI